MIRGLLCSYSWGVSRNSETVAALGLLVKRRSRFPAWDSRFFSASPSRNVRRARTHY